MKAMALTNEITSIASAHMNRVMPAKRFQDLLERGVFINNFVFITGFLYRKSGFNVIYICKDETASIPFISAEPFCVFPYPCGVGTF